MHDAIDIRWSLNYILYIVYWDNRVAAGSRRLKLKKKTYHISGLDQFKQHKNNPKLTLGNCSSIGNVCWCLLWRNITQFCLQFSSTKFGNQKCLSSFFFSTQMFGSAMREINHQNSEFTSFRMLLVFSLLFFVFLFFASLVLHSAKNDSCFHHK